MTEQLTQDMHPRFPAYSRGNWVRLRTLIALRWLAICGQLGAVLVASLVFSIDLRLDLCGLAIAASALFNVIALASNPANKRLTELTVTLTLIFDVSQLVVLLYLTGGLSNPFSLLLLAPVTISATVLSLAATLIIGSVAIIAITGLIFYWVPLQLIDGTTIVPPTLLVTGMWASLVIGIIFVAGYARRITADNLTMSEALAATQMALAREQQLTALGGVVAAAAHELGTPLATIKLVSTELAEDLSDRPELLEDVELIKSQSERCRDILRDMGRSGRDDALVHHAPMSAVIAEAAEPHMNRGVTVSIRPPEDGSDNTLPLIPRHPGLIHGLRNLIQNAVDFAQKNVWLDMGWDDTTIWLQIGDDGAGFSPDLEGLLGEPYVGTRRKAGGFRKSRPDYEGMGLGLFIAKTLLERTGARLNFANADLSDQNHLQNTQDPSWTQPTGAVVTVEWERKRLVTETDPTRDPLGQNALNQP